MNRRLVIGIGTAAAVLAAGGGVAALTWPSSPAPVAASADGAITSIPPDPAAKPPAVQASVDAVDIAPADAAATTLTVPQRGTKPFSMVSVSWSDPAARPQGTVQVRTRDAKSGKWSGWQDLAVAEGAADEAGEAARAKGATEPLWAGRANGVAARIVAGATPGPLPAGLRLNLIDPDAKPTGGQGGGDPVPSDTPPEGDPSPPASGEPSDEVTTEPTNPPVTTVPTAPATTPVPTATSQAPATTVPPTATTTAPKPTTTTTVAPIPTKPVPVPTSTVPVLAQLPPYVSRAGWNADETLVKYAIDVAAKAKMIWVHHTGFGNNYTCAQSASVVRGIQVNDVKVKGLNDMGYNFLVDKCGTLFEGRKGGVTKAVIGAHTVGFNTGSVGVALLGDYTSIQPPTVALTTIAQVSAARLGAYGFNPTSSAQMTEGVTGRKWPINTSVTFPRISGHKDGEMTSAGYLTECPGDKFYPLLASVRARSVQMITGLAARSLGGGTSVGGVFYVRTGVSITWAVATPTTSIARWELLLDGRVYKTLPAAARSGSYALKPGNHTISVRAVHVQGGTAVTPAYRVVADVTAPTFPVAPNPLLRAGTYSAASVPVTVGYRAADNAKVYTVVATSPARVNLPATGTAWYRSVKPGAALAYTLTARDPSGNARTSTVKRKVTLLAETKAKRGGKWTAKSSKNYVAGKALTASKKNAKLTYTFTGRSAALLFSRGTKTGKAYVYLDGKKVATIDTKAGKNTYRQALWVRALTAKKHTVAIVVAGTGGRPAVVSDGLAYVS